MPADVQTVFTNRFNEALGTELERHGTSSSQQRPAVIREGRLPEPSEKPGPGRVLRAA